MPDSRRQREIFRLFVKLNENLIVPLRPRQFEYKSETDRVGIYPDLAAFEKLGVPMVAEARRNDLVGFEDLNFDSARAKKCRRQ
jgi:hypothetical protein